MALSSRIHGISQRGELPDQLSVHCWGVAGNVFTSTDPTGGAGAWSEAHIGEASTINKVSCPTAAFCVALSGSNLFLSTNPTGGAGAWSKTELNGGTYLAGLSCASASLCVGVDGGSSAFTSSNPLGGAETWHSQFIDPNTNDGQVLIDVVCSSETLCAATDWQGDVILGTPAPSHTLTISKAGSGAGTVTSAPAGINCGVACNSEFPVGATIALTATPQPGSTFAGWSGGGCSGIGTCELTLTSDTNSRRPSTRNRHPGEEANRLAGAVGRQGGAGVPGVAAPLEGAALPLTVVPLRPEGWRGGCRWSRGARQCTARPAASAPVSSN